MMGSSTTAWPDGKVHTHLDTQVGEFISIVRGGRGVCRGPWFDGLRATLAKSLHDHDVVTAGFWGKLR
jgi:hypothetical protein